MGRGGGVADRLQALEHAARGQRGAQLGQDQQAVFDRLVEVSGLREGSSQTCSVISLVAGRGRVVKDGLPKPDGLGGRAESLFTERLAPGG